MELRNREDIAPFETLDGSTIREIVHPSNSNVKNQSLAEATVKPGQTTQEHQHPRSEEIYYILQGRGIMKLGDVSEEVGAMDAILIPPANLHSIENTGNEDLIFLCLCSPPYSDEDIITASQGP